MKIPNFKCIYFYDSIFVLRTTYAWKNCMSTQGQSQLILIYLSSRKSFYKIYNIAHICFITEVLENSNNLRKKSHLILIVSNHED